MENDKPAQNREQTAADALSKVGAESGIELSETQLGDVSGGAGDIFAKIGDIKGESLDSEHKGEIEILSAIPKIAITKPFQR